ncbi:HNH endonuclease signature motif containing protein [Corynebacterium aquatimens]|uniref:HNH nuclease domain-containing protein n=1 Tax=Corynebacterium aquatimens TaxID=1190508 RepID=A0A931E2Q1_9CORY|nr:HNH endonuclease signature motif containing protein [Corynebacterium aquatimens]MBG6122842.1 hypothetical protein [Corynebacterium aquatimens]WJY66823.1 hypothetical protein CAQUA_10685 [Corynebacterium aquatimens]
MSTRADGDGGGSSKIGAPEPYFTVERFEESMVAAAHIAREAEYSLFSCFSEPGFGEIDMDLTVAGYQRDTGMNKRAITRAVLGYARLQDLPMLRALQEESKLLDVSRLAAIDTVMSDLGNAVDGCVYVAIDEFLVDLFTPTSPNQAFPGTGTIYYHLPRIIGQIDPGLRYDRARRKRREKQAEERATVAFISRAGGKTMEYDADNATIAAVREFIEATAREQEISPADAITMLLTGKITPSPNITLFGYVPTAPSDQGGQPIDGAAVYFPASGWTNTHGLASLEEMGGTDGARLIHLEGVESEETTSYTPTARMKAFCAGRDGTCLWPGCSLKAEKCQLDHRVPFDEGGPTTPGNLFSLCQHHHNVKTDRRAYYLVDPSSGDIVWLFDDGTYALNQPDGFIGDHLTPRDPQWKQTLTDIQVARRHASEFYARAHAIADKIENAYDRKEDPAELFKELHELEQLYGISFNTSLLRPPF